MRKVIVVGAGIGGMVTAGLLSKRGFKVTLFERSNICGGRSHVVSKDGFSMSYGAHALIAPKSKLMKSILAELDIRVEGNRPSSKQFFLFCDGELIPGLVGPAFFTSKAVQGVRNRLEFLFKFLKFIRGEPVYDPTLTVGGWIEKNVQDDRVATLLRAYAALSTYDGGIDEYPMNAFVEHTRLMYASTLPLTYVNFGSYLKTLEHAVMRNGGEIRYGQRVAQLVIRNDRVCGVVTGEEVHEADAVVLNLPPKQLAELSTDQLFLSEIQPVLKQPATYAMVYDVILDNCVRDDVKNVLDPETLVYINNMSLNCPSTTPKGKQMLNCLKLLSGPEQADQGQADVERVLDTVFPTWRDHLRHRRIINRAMVQGVSTRVGAHRLPLQSRMTGLFYVGDSTDRKGGFSIPAYDSALNVANLITASTS